MVALTGLVLTFTLWPLGRTPHGLREAALKASPLPALALIPPTHACHDAIGAMSGEPRSALICHNAPSHNATIR